MLFSAIAVLLQFQSSLWLLVSVNMLGGRAVFAGRVKKIKKEIFISFAREVSSSYHSFPGWECLIEFGLHIMSVVIKWNGQTQTTVVYLQRKSLQYIQG